jgi:hypothetical protein
LKDILLSVRRLFDLRASSLDQWILRVLGQAFFHAEKCVLYMEESMSENTDGLSDPL